MLHGRPALSRIYQEHGECHAQLARTNRPTGPESWRDGHSKGPCTVDRRFRLNSHPCCAQTGLPGHVPEIPKETQSSLRWVARLHQSLGWAVLGIWTGGWMTERLMLHADSACKLCGCLCIDTLRHFVVCMVVRSMVVQLLPRASDAEAGPSFDEFWRLVDGRSPLGPRGPTPPLPSFSPSAQHSSEDALMRSGE